MNILIVGVGGQGTLLTSKVLGRYATLIGSDVKLSEVHGMAQRGGSVVTHVRIADVIHSPIIWEGGADVVLAFEKLEGLRAAHFLKPNGVLLVNDMKIYPMPVITGAAKYPEDIDERLAEKGVNTFSLDALALSREAGNVKSVNIVMLGALTAAVNMDYEKMKTALVESVPEKFRDVNLAALQAGYQAYKKGC